MRRLAREVLIDFATRLKHSLTHEQADQLYLEASGLIPREHPPHTATVVALALLRYRVEQNETGLNRFKLQLSKAQNWTEIETLVKTVWN